MSKIAQHGQIGKEHHAWKGNAVGYQALHSWIRRQLGKATKCMGCKSYYNVQWANKSHNYKRELEDWMQLCGKCHMKYDGYKRWVGHILNKAKACYCGRQVWARNLCHLHLQQQYRKERKISCHV